MPLKERLEILGWAKHTNSLVIEDDYDGEYRYSGAPIPALYALDKNDSVIYVGTFSKILFPSLRIGYLAVPEKLIDIYTWAKRLTDSFSPLLEQAALADFINNGSLEKHVLRMRKIYERKRMVLERSLNEHFNKTVNILGENAGLYLTARIKTDLEDKTVIEKVAKLGVGIRTTSRDYLSDSYTQSEFFFGYGNLEEKEIKEGIKRFASVFFNWTIQITKLVKAWSAQLQVFTVHL